MKMNVRCLDVLHVSLYVLAYKVKDKEILVEVQPSSVYESIYTSFFASLETGFQRCAGKRIWAYPRLRWACS